MAYSEEHSLEFSIPIEFSDGSGTLETFANEYKRHSKGFFIMAPSGAGKTYFVNHQKEKHWIDGDAVWVATKAQPKGPWWLESLEVMDEIDQRCDVITAQYKRLGFWIIGASNYWLKPDAIVLPHWSTHKKYIKTREQEHYDGGATLDRLPQVLGHRKWIKKWAKQGVPEFKTIEDATTYLANSIL